MRRFKLPDRDMVTPQLRTENKHTPKATDQVMYDLNYE
jgi:hypothetical protein